MGVCPYGIDGEKKPSSPSSVPIDQALILSLFDNPLFNAIVVILFPVIQAGNAIWESLFSALHSINSDIPAYTTDFSIDVANLCKNSPSVFTNADTPTYQELYASMLGVLPAIADLTEKMAKIVYANLWYKYCKCGTKKSVPTPLPIITPPQCPLGSTPRVQYYGLWYSDEAQPTSFVRGVFSGGYFSNITQTPFPLSSDNTFLFEARNFSEYWVFRKDVYGTVYDECSPSDGNPNCQYVGSTLGWRDLSTAHQELIGSYPLMMIGLDLNSNGTYTPKGSPINTNTTGLPDLICEYPEPEIIIDLPIEPEEEKFNCDIPNDCGISEAKEYEIAQPDYDPAYASLATNTVSLDIPDFDGSVTTKTYTIFEE